MAIIEELGLGVAIMVDGTEVPEHDDPENREQTHGDKTKVCNKYAEVVEDAEFSIKYHATEKQTWLRKGKDHCLSFEFTVDGQFVTSYIARNDSHRPHFVLGMVTPSESGDGEELRKFRFKPIVTVDDASKQRVEQDSGLAKNLGLIQVTVYKRTYLGPSTGKSVSTCHSRLQLTEKALKGRAISHGTSYSDPVPTKRTTYAKTKLQDSSPLAIFNIKYRSRAAMRSEMIIPRSPSPALSAGPSGLNGLGPNDIERLALERLQQIKEEKCKGRKAVKRERNETLDLTGPDERPRKVARRSSAKVTIDLTDD